MQKIINIKPGGLMEFVHDDRLRGLLHQGQAQIGRASTVEPGDPAKGQNPLCWFTNLAPISGPLLGPFQTRSEALGQEQEWINLYHLTPLNKQVPSWATLGIYGIKFESTLVPFGIAVCSPLGYLSPAGQWSQGFQIAVPDVGMTADLQARKLAVAALQPLKELKRQEPQHA